MQKTFYQYGIYFVLEGGDGSGKDTQMKMLENYLNVCIPHPAIRCIREPGSTDIAEKVRGWLMSPPPLVSWKTSSEVETIDAIAQLCAFNFARRQTLVHHVRPLLAEGRVILSGRSYLSTLAYQAYAGGLDIDLVRALCLAVVEGYVPDRIYFFDVPAEVAKQRVEERATTSNEQLTVYDVQPLEYFEKVREGYLVEARRNPELIEVIDANRPPETVFADLYTSVSQILRSRPVRT